MTVFASSTSTTVLVRTSFLSQNRRTFAPGIQSRYGLGFGGFCV